MRPEAGALVGMVFAYAFFAVAGGANGFTSLVATAGWLDESAQLGIVVVPMAMLLMAGEFDLSIGSVISCTTLIVAIAVQQYGLPVEVAIALALIVAALVGFVNGILVVRTKLPSFIITLATYLALAGLTLTLSRLLTNALVVSVKLQGWVTLAFGGQLEGSAGSDRR